VCATEAQSDPQGVLGLVGKGAAVLNLAGFVCAAVIPQISPRILLDLSRSCWFLDPEDLPSVVEVTLGSAALVFLVPAIVLGLFRLRDENRAVRKLRVAIAASAVSSLAVPIFTFGLLSCYAVNLIALIGCPLLAWRVRPKMGPILTVLLAVLPVPFLLLADMETLAGWTLTIVCPICLVVAFLSRRGATRRVEPRWAAVVGTLPILLAVPVLAWYGLFVLLNALLGGI